MHFAVLRLQFLIILIAFHPSIERRDASLPSGAAVAAAAAGQNSAHCLIAVSICYLRC